MEQYGPGHVLIEEGQISDRAYFIMEGQLRLVKKNAKSQKLLTKAINEPADDYGLPLRAIPRKTKASVKSRALNSIEIDTYTLGIRYARNWLGEEVLYLSET